MNKQTETDLTIATDSAGLAIKDIKSILKEVAVRIERKEWHIVDILVADLRKNAKHIGNTADAIERIAADEKDYNA
jgi:hypothetical protein